MNIVEQELQRLSSPDPGPINPIVLTLQNQHRSNHIWDNNENAPDDHLPTAFRRVETRLQGMEVPPCDAVMHYIRLVGLEGLWRVPFVQLDRGLLTALIERWCPETHTLHISEVEMTVTLQDVEVLLGLPVDGEAVTGTNNLENILAMCMTLLGRVPISGVRDVPDEIKGQKVMMAWLEQFDGQVEEGDNEEVIRQKARGLFEDAWGYDIC